MEYENTEDNNAIMNAINKWYKKEKPEKEYKTDKRIIKDIIQHHIKPTNEEHIISLIIYYNTKKTSQLVIKNKTTKKKSPTRRPCHLQTHLQN
ncbi:hypothetical protein E2C01_069215 [Portunus trituberculatus]|uniref:Uncharacterized protein n=1 Tax=Portunus trituberculatus TaxID=210409 RepID=A0A5B7HYS1_PORTR|nr:hypothetical protein [Portunus trituberculatus]